MPSDHGHCDHDVECETCGAPRAQGLAACAYCKTAYPGVHGGVRCPRCADVNLRENPTCISCQAPLVQGCLFCGARSPLDAAQCVRCREAFAGAAERKKLRDEAHQREQAMQVAAQGVGLLATVATTVAAATTEHHAHGHQEGGLLHAIGDLFEAATGGGDDHSHHQHHHHHHGHHHDD